MKINLDISFYKANISTLKPKISEMLTLLKDSECLSTKCKNDKFYTQLKRTIQKCSKYHKINVLVQKYCTLNGIELRAWKIPNNPKFKKFSIDANVPFPDGYVLAQKYPFRTMKAGESFAVPCPVDRKKEGLVRTTMGNSARRLGIEITIRKVFEGGKIVLRAWRLA